MPGHLIERLRIRAASKSNFVDTGDLTSTDQVFDRSAEKGPGIYESTSWKKLVDHYS
jgi:hypothetical protein